MLGQALLVASSAYLLGSIPFGYLLYKLGQGEDIRATGSGSIGATNVLRAAGIAAGAATLLLDAGKGYLAVALAAGITGNSPAWTGLAAVLAIVGHIFPVFLKFRGGKGVATGLGAFFAIAPSSLFVCLGIFLVVATGWRYVSLASIAAAGAFPLVLLVRGDGSAPTLAAAALGAGLIIASHRSNIQRLRRGTESPIRGRTRRSLGSGGSQSGG